MKHGIKVQYRGITMQFTECKFFAFFELLGWDFEFQPHEMDYYLPDFLVRFDGTPHYVEVKGGASTLTALRKESQKIFTNSIGFSGHKTLVGTDPSIVIGDSLPLPESWRDTWLEAIGIADRCRVARHKLTLQNPSGDIVSNVIPIELRGHKLTPVASEVTGRIVKHTMF